MFNVLRQSRSPASHRSVYHVLLDLCMGRMMPSLNAGSKADNRACLAKREAFPLCALAPHQALLD